MADDKSIGLPRPACCALACGARLVAYRKRRRLSAAAGQAACPLRPRRIISNHLQCKVIISLLPAQQARGRCRAPPGPSPALPAAPMRGCCCCCGGGGGCGGLRSAQHRTARHAGWTQGPAAPAAAAAGAACGARSENTAITAPSSAIHWPSSAIIAHASSAGGSINNDGARASGRVCQGETGRHYGQSKQPQARRLPIMATRHHRRRSRRLVRPAGGRPAPGWLAGWQAGWLAGGGGGGTRCPGRQLCPWRAAAACAAPTPSGCLSLARAERLDPRAPVRSPASSRHG
jgi:hypothetical protein